MGPIDSAQSFESQEVFASQVFAFPSLQSDAAALRMVKWMHPDQPPSRWYRSAAQVAACVRQSHAFRESAEQAGVAVLPLLRYYELLHAMKALLYLMDPAYPPGSSVLQHGLSLRKTKRALYHWPLESVYVQREGVLQSFAALCGVPELLPQRFVIGDLLGMLPVMVPLMSSFWPQFVHLYPVRCCPDGWMVSRRIAANSGQTPEEWLRSYAAWFTQGNAEMGPSASQEEQWGEGEPLRGCGRCSCSASTQSAVRTRAPAEAQVHRGTPAAPNVGASANHPQGQFRVQPDPTGLHPWVHRSAQGIFLGDGHCYPTWLVHFVLLFTLASLCRYNPLEWSDIVLWNQEIDGLLVRQYLKDAESAGRAVEGVYEVMCQQRQQRIAAQE